MSNPATPDRQIRAQFTDQTITVYQAYSPTIAEPAVAARKFVPPFKLGRMTWIKPSFLWMMYRSGWAEKPGQEHILAIRITREGFLWALEHSCLSHFVRDIHGTSEQWAADVKSAPVRIQWDPERSVRLARLDHRSIQIGLSGTAVERYVEEWTAGIEDVTELAREIHSLVRAGRDAAAIRLLPDELPFPLPAEITKRVDCSDR